MFVSVIVATNNIRVFEMVAFLESEPGQECVPVYLQNGSIYGTIFRESDVHQSREDATLFGGAEGFW